MSPPQVAATAATGQEVGATTAAPPEACSCLVSQRSKLMPR